jgi:hypothetical protein
MLKSKKSTTHREALRRVKRWTRERFALPDDAVISVSEIACSLPGCPPLETVVVFWTTAETRHHFKIFKPAEEVVEDDLPPAWMKNALIAVDGVGCDCC